MQADGVVLDLLPALLDFTLAFLDLDQQAVLPFGDGARVFLRPAFVLAPLLFLRVLTGKDEVVPGRIS